jgi:hypothetical protein
LGACVHIVYAMLITYLGRDIFLCESSTTARDNQVGVVGTICVGFDSAPNGGYVVCNYPSLCCLPAISAILLKDLLQRRDAFVG